MIFSNKIPTELSYTLGDFTLTASKNPILVAQVCASVQRRHACIKEAHRDGKMPRWAYEKQFQTYKSTLEAPGTSHHPFPNFTWTECICSETQ